MQDVVSHAAAALLKVNADLPANKERKLADVRDEIARYFELNIEPIQLATAISTQLEQNSEIIPLLLPLVNNKALECDAATREIIAEAMLPLITIQPNLNITSIADINALLFGEVHDVSA